MTLTRRAVLIALSLGASTAIAHAARASLTWNWHYQAPGIAASGTFTTADDPDSGGFYQITAISGTRNGVAITALQPTGTPIPGNAPFAVDNLLSASGPQLTKHGFGFATADGDFANPFYADFTTPAGYVEFFSTPPFTGPGNTELPVTFTATVPEPGAAVLMGLPLLGLLAASRREAARTPGRRADPGD